MMLTGLVLGVYLQRAPVHDERDLLVLGRIADGLPRAQLRHALPHLRVGLVVGGAGGRRSLGQRAVQVIQLLAQRLAGQADDLLQVLPLAVQQAALLGYRNGCLRLEGEEKEKKKKRMSGRTGRGRGRTTS
jgi:hypothetical protein